MAGGNRSRDRSRPRARAASAVAPFPRGATGGRLELSRLAPSGRSLLTGFLILATALGLYAAARTTSAFSVDTIEVTGVTPEVAAQVREALAPAVGESLLELDVGELSRRARGVPMVSGVGFDRAFPHTLAVAVVPETPVAVLRQGGSSWLAAASGRVVGGAAKGALPTLPRVWLKRDVEIVVGEQVGGTVLRAVTTVAPLVRNPLPARVASVEATEETLRLKLRSGLELRLGNAADLAVKLEVARRVLPLLEPDSVAQSSYLDVSVPERPVAGSSLNSQVEVESSTSTVP